MELKNTPTLTSTRPILMAALAALSLNTACAQAPSNNADILKPPAVKGLVIPADGKTHCLSTVDGIKLDTAKACAHLEFEDPQH